MKKKIISLSEILDAASRERTANEILFDSILEGDFRKFQKALSEGADINARTPQDDIQTGNSRSTPLIEVSWRTSPGHDRIFDYLLSRKDIEINNVDGQNISAIMKALLAGRSDRAEKLIGAGANLLQKDSEGWDVIVCAKLGAPDMIQRLQYAQLAQLAKQNPGNSNPSPK